MTDWKDRKRKTRFAYQHIDEYLQPFISTRKDQEDVKAYHLFQDYPPRIWLQINFTGKGRRSAEADMYDLSDVLGQFCDRFGFDCKSKQCEPEIGYTRAREYVLTLKFYLDDKYLKAYHKKGSEDAETNR